MTSVAGCSYGNTGDGAIQKSSNIVAIAKMPFYFARVCFPGYDSSKLIEEGEEEKKAGYLSSNERIKETDRSMHVGYDSIRSMNKRCQLQKQLYGLPKKTSFLADFFLLE